jgi:serine/threonine-protein kinase RsbW
VTVSELVLSLKNDPAEIERLAGRVVEFCAHQDVPEAATAQLNLALDEAITNIIFYAYDDAGEHEIGVRVTFARGILKAELVDDGREFDPLQVAPPDLAAPLEERHVGGLGVHLVRRLMDDCQYRREQGHNHFAFAKRVA